MARHVYVAGPLSAAPVANAVEAMRFGNQLLAHGIMPFIPHLAVWWDLQYRRTYEDWMVWDLAWLSRCDAVLRIPGHSPGADREVAFAAERGIPVFTSVDELIAWAASDAPGTEEPCGACGGSRQERVAGGHGEELVIPCSMCQPSQPAESEEER